MTCVLVTCILCRVVLCSLHYSHIFHFDVTGEPDFVRCFPDPNDQIDFIKLTKCIQQDSYSMSTLLADLTRMVSWLLTQYGVCV